jgi:hypothetical protein
MLKLNSTSKSIGNIREHAWGKKNTKVKSGKEN